MTELYETAARTTVGLTTEGRDALDRVMSAGWFTHNYDAFKFAVAFALAAGITPTSDSGSFSTIWNRGTLDPDERLSKLVNLLSPSPDIWDQIRRLGDAGLREMIKRNIHIGFPSEVLDVISE